MRTPSMQHASRITLFIGYAALCALSAGFSASAIGSTGDTLPQADQAAPAETTGDKYAEGSYEGNFAADSEITGEVRAAIVHDPELTSSEIGVETDNGRVMLRGQVDSQAEIDRAGDLALAIRGVSVVINYMQVKDSQ